VLLAFRKHETPREGAGLASDLDQIEAVCGNPLLSQIELIRKTA
jgi:hypothetical protein